MVENKKYESYWSKDNINTVPDLMHTALEMEKNQGGGPFTTLFNNYNVKMKKQFYEDIEKDPTKKAYYMPNPKQGLTAEDEARIKSDRDLELSKVNAAEEAYMKQFTKPILDSYGKPIIDETTGKPKWEVNVEGISSSIKDQKGKGVTPNAILNLQKEVPLQIQEFGKQRQRINANADDKLLKSSAQLNKNQKLAETRKAELEASSNKFVKQSRKKAEDKTAVIAEPIKAIGKEFDQMGTRVWHGRGMRRG